MKRIQSLTLGLVLACFGTTTLFAQADKTAGDDIKEAGRATKKALKRLAAR